MAKFTLTLLFAFLAMFSVISAVWIGDAPSCPIDTEICPDGLKPTCLARSAEDASIACPDTCGDFDSPGGRTSA
ncbi:uncharacterized protein BYT42DRAFT_649344 [Radiomyces spectabilis]|uniref:uncharacterized protein n=1 Tax=Radiomyces spectabilis TaxID=64574 RepID=UPI0022212373|nr:uncharacterized protein BYT42DRAFT_649344 [Radiomyces spectabilis]KAI8364679.1 hypothetical protein BYT42DRAFT_649344 [Radiomyces spectabilis]